MSLLTIHLGIFSVLILSSVLAEIPSYIHVCHQSDPQFNQCVINSIVALTPKLKQGIPELKVPSIEPLPLKEVKLRSGPAQAKIDADITNLLVWNCSLYKIEDFEMDFNKRIFKVKVFLPTLDFKADYDMDLNVLIVKYKGKGKMSGKLTGYKADFNVQYDLVKKDGKDYMHINTLRLKLYPNKSHISLDQLFKENTALSKGIAEVIQDNSELIMNEIIPVLEEGLSNTLTEIVNHIAGSYPFEELVPV